MEKLLITGATGFVGSAIARECGRAGLPVHTTDRIQAPRSAVPNYTVSDILDGDGLRGVMKGASMVVHAAGLAHQFHGAAPSLFEAVNANGTENAVRVAIEVGVQHFVLVSSVSVYGREKNGSCDESAPCLADRSDAYAWSKLEAEKRALRWAQDSDARLTILRLATVYGEGDPGNVARLMGQIDRGRFVWVGSGTNHKSLVHRDDVARACVAVLRAPGPEEAIYNLSAPPCTVREIVDGLASALGRRVPRWKIPPALALGAARAGAAALGERSRAGRFYGTLQKWLSDERIDSRRFCDAFSFSTEVETAEGLRREVEWYLNQRLESGQ